jgi:hypothetical protein
VLFQRFDGRKLAETSTGGMQLIFARNDIEFHFQPRE